MLCHHYKTIFVHIPKTAGQSIENVFIKKCELTWETRAPLLLRRNDKSELGPPRLAHLKARQYVSCQYTPQSMFDRYFKFAFVRNPWSRVVSFYKYLGYHRKMPFRHFVTEHLPFKLMKEWDWFVGPQYDFVCGEDESILVDYIGKFETLQNDFDEVCRKIGITPEVLAHINRTHSTPARSKSKLKRYIKTIVSQVRSRGQQSFSDYRDYYDRDTRETVRRLYVKDIECFEYDFG